MGIDLFDSWARLYRGVSKQKIQERFTAFLKSIVEDGDAGADRALLPLLSGLDDHIEAFVGTVSALAEYNIIPTVAREPTEPMPSAQMAPDGRGIAEVIHALEEKLFGKLLPSGADGEPHLQHRSSSLEYLWPLYALRYARWSPLRNRIPFLGRRDSRRYERLLKDALQQITAHLVQAVRPLRRITTRIDPTTGKRHVEFVMGDNSGPDGQLFSFRADEMSDGTIKWLCILGSLFVPRAPIYLLEEPENFLHPWMQQELVRLMRAKAKGSETAYLITTHSTTILNAVFADEVVLVSNEGDGTVLRRVPARHAIRSALEETDFNLGDLWVSGAIEAVPE